MYRLMERELRRAMAAAEQEPLLLYPDGRDYRAPTARRVLVYSKRSSDTRKDDNSEADWGLASSCVGEFDRCAQPVFR